MSQHANTRDGVSICKIHCYENSRKKRYFGVEEIFEKKRFLKIHKFQHV